MIDILALFNLFVEFLRRIIREGRPESNIRFDIATIQTHFKKSLLSLTLVYVYTHVSRYISL